MANTTPFRRPIGRRTILQGGASLALATAFTGIAPRAHAAGGKVIIGAFADGGLVPFKEKIIPLAKAEGGVDVQTLTYRNDVYTNGAPKTWDELIAKGKAGVAAGKIKYPVVFRGVSGGPIVASWYPVFLSWGGEFFDDKWNVTFNSPAGKAS